MRKEFKDTLYEKMLQYGTEFGLINLTYPSFRRVSNYTSQIAAADLVVSITAMLERPSTEDETHAHVTNFANAKATLCSNGIKDVMLRDGVSSSSGRH